MRSTGWVPALCAAAAADSDGSSYCVFGDVAFGLTAVVQVIVKSVHYPDDRTYNAGAIMSKIRLLSGMVLLDKATDLFSSAFQEQQNGRLVLSDTVRCGLYLHEHSMYFLRQSVFLKSSKKFDALTSC